MAAKTTAVKLNEVMPTELKDLMKEDGAPDVEAIDKLVHSQVTDDQYREFQKEAIQKFRPKGMVELYGATWDCGWEGKLQVATSILGKALVAATLLEIAGRLMDVPSLQLLSMASRKVLGD